MYTSQTIAELAGHRAVPVVRTSRADLAEIAVDWLAEAGFAAVEITLTIPGGVDLIRRLAARGDILVGAGTVLKRDEAEACIEAGARFIVSPCVVPAIAPVCREAGIACLMGAMTPTEMHTAAEAGADAIKVFPASHLGGPSYLKAVRAIFPHLVLMPTGGIDAHTLPDYLAAGAAFVGIGGRLVDEEAVRRGDRNAILTAAHAVLDAVKKH